MRRTRAILVCAGPLTVHWRAPRAWTSLCCGMTLGNAPMKKSWARSIGRWNLPRSDCDQVGATAIVSKGERREKISVNYLLLPPLTTAGPVIIRCFFVSTRKFGIPKGQRQRPNRRNSRPGQRGDRERDTRPPEARPAAGKWCAIAVVDRCLCDSSFRQGFSRLKEGCIENYYFKRVIRLNISICRIFYWAPVSPQPSDLLDDRHLFARRWTVIG
jgi:hypothetical protein